MKFLSAFFTTIRETARLKRELEFWRSRTFTFEKKYETEVERNRHRERGLIDRIIESKGFNPIKDRAEKQFSESAGIQTPESTVQKKMKKEIQEREDAEKKAFVEDCIKQGKTKEEAEEYFAANKREIITQN